MEELDTGAVVQIGSAQTQESVSGIGRPQIEWEAGASQNTQLPPEADIGQQPPIPAGTAVIFDTPAKPLQPVRLTELKALPRPRGFVSTLSPQQTRMRQLAIAVAHRFARAPGVLRAKLDRRTFVALFTTMIHRESDFNVNAVSPVGAKGLGQLMPGTARDLGVCDVFSPGDNLNGAATYLTMMLEQFGSPSMALAAYNAGPAAVVKYGGVPPFRETRQYVADIINATNSATPFALTGNAMAYQADEGFRAGSLVPSQRSSAPELCHQAAWKTTAPKSSLTAKGAFLPTLQTREADHEHQV